jgi:hypothetical protein
MTTKITTLFDSDREEYEYIQEQIEKQAIEEMARDKSKIDELKKKYTGVET